METFTFGLSKTYIHILDMRKSVGFLSTKSFLSSQVHSVLLFGGQLLVQTVTQLPRGVANNLGQVWQRQSAPASSNWC